MVKAKKSLLIALILPILSLAVLAGYKRYILSVGQQVTLPIKGYDPRDLLSGHYLNYTVDYGVKSICPGAFQFKKPGYVCLSSKTFSYHWPEDCDLFIQGTCDANRFDTGLNRFYVPEKEAKKLEDLLRAKDASVVLAIPSNGKAQVKDLLIDGVSWRSQ